jgi:hypothetical protein
MRQDEKTTLAERKWLPGMVLWRKRHSCQFRHFLM